MVTIDSSKSGASSLAGATGLAGGRGPLGLDADLLNACVSCGLCLPHCPTYRVTTEESASPRGRITMMRSVESGELAVDDDFVNFMERCVMCRGCETACPSGVQFGSLMEQTRVALAHDGKLAPPAWMSPSLRALRFHRLLLLGSSGLGIAQRLRLLPDGVRRRFGLPAHIPIRRPKLTSDRGPVDVWLYTGCVMDAWQREVHVATKNVLQRAGAESVGLPSGAGSCCGALHLHAGQKGDAEKLAKAVMRSMPGSAPIVVDSAGCGAAMKDYGHLLGTDEANAFSARVFDAAEWVAQRMNKIISAHAESQADSRASRVAVAVQDPCHLRHVQRAHQHVRTVLAPFYDLREIADDGRCCGAGGSYSLSQPELAHEIREQKVTAIDATGASVVASANPGCSMWLTDAPPSSGGKGSDPHRRIVHPMVLLDEALSNKPLSNKPLSNKPLSNKPPAEASSGSA